MNIVDASLKRPIAMMCLIIALLMFGFQCFRSLGLDFFPNIDTPYITVSVTYPGASPSEIEANVVRRIEDAVATVEGLKRMNSICLENFCQTILEFHLGRDENVCALDVREKMDTVLSDLPADIETPEIKKLDPNASKVVTLALTGSLPLGELYDYADDRLRTMFSSREGVADVDIIGSEEREMLVFPDRVELAARGLNANDVVQILARSNVRIPGGTIDDGAQEYSVTFDAQASSAEALGEIQIGVVAGVPVLLRDVAEIRFDTEKIKNRAFLDEQPAIVIQITKKGDANAVQTVRNIRAAYEEALTGLPGGMQLHWFLDETSFIEGSVDDSFSSIVMGIALTAFLLFFFLQDWRSSLIAALTMPSSIVITFIGMKIFNYTFNISTLLALGTGVGVLVSNTIVVIENIMVRMNEGATPQEAARRGASEVILAVLASAVTNVAVFVPMALMTSLVGQFFVPFAVVTAVATVVSLFISFTFAPILASKFMKPVPSMQRHLAGTDAAAKAEEKPNRFRWNPITLLLKLWERVYEALERAYDFLLGLCVRFSGLTLLATLGLFVLVMVLIGSNLGMDFIPDNDRDQLTVQLELPSDANLDETQRRVMALREKIMKLDAVVSTTVTIGKIQAMIGKPSEGSYLSEILVKMKPMAERPKEPLDVVRAQVRAIVAEEYNCIAAVLIPSPIGGSSKTIEMEVSGPDLDQLETSGREGAARAQRGGYVTEVEHTVRIGKPEIRVYPRREILHDLGIPESAIGATVRASIEGIEVSTFQVGDRAFDVRVRLDEQDGAGQIASLALPGPDGHTYPLEALADPVRGATPILITRSDKQRVVKLLANAAEGTALATAVNRLTDEMARLLPHGYHTRMVGIVEKMNELNADFSMVLVLALLLTYLTLAGLLESWTQPLLIYASVPTAAMGIVIGLTVGRTNMSAMVLLATVMLIGIVVNNAILIIDQINVLRREQNMPARDAVLAASRAKFRPIVMTSLAAVVGMLPLALGHGIGYETRAPVGIASVGGLLISAILTVFVVPALYAFFYARHDKKPEQPNQPDPQPQPPPAPHAQA